MIFRDDPLPPFVKGGSCLRASTLQPMPERLYPERWSKRPTILELSLHHRAGAFCFGEISVNKTSPGRTFALYAGMLKQ